jgi:MinD-like ATPase involved in chromosome partitioning or flagellar assembly
MTDNFHHFRVVALDLRSRKLGFAVLEGSRKLLDWGIKGCRTHRDLAHVAQKRIAPVLTLFAPSVVILEAASSRKAEEPRREVISKAIQAEVLRRSIDLVFVRKDEIRDSLGKGEPITKQKIASHIVLLFPELTWELPQERKPWQSEHHNMAVFDAIALALAYWAQCNISPQRDQ